MTFLGPGPAGPVYSDVFSTTETLTNKTWVNGKAIYRKVVSFGSLPNNTTKSVAHNITGQTYVVFLSVMAYDGTNYYPVPQSGTFGDQTWIDATNIYIQTNSNRSTETAYFIIEYTK